MKLKTPAVLLALTASLTACGASDQQAAPKAPASAASSSASRPPSQPAAQDTLGTSFVIAIWQQGEGSFTTWKSRGINTVVGVPNGKKGTNGRTNVARWDAALAASGLRGIRRPLGDRPSTDPGRSNPHLIAWILPDEPENNLARPKPLTPADIKKMYQDNKANHTRPRGSNRVGTADVAPIASSGDSRATLRHDP